jgi:cytoskeletal protein RodZ
LTGIGETLRQARISLGLDLEQAADATSIRARYLDDLEAERFDRLPAPVYTRGFLREYADVLGLDADVLLAWYDQANRELVRPEIVARPTTRLPRRRGAAGRRTVIVTSIGLGALALWAYGRTSEPSPVTTFAHRAALVPPATRQAPAAQATRRPALVAVVSAARGDCWISVRVGSRDGTVVHEGMLREGQTVRLGLKRALWVRLGAPWNVDVRVAGRATKPLDSGRPMNVLLSRTGSSPA